MAYLTHEPTAARRGVNSLKGALLTASALAALALSAQSASAQVVDEAVPPPPDIADSANDTFDAAKSDIVVTGSRLIREGLSSPTPVTSVSTAELLATRPQSIVQGLAELPALSSRLRP